ncbi:LamG-like jellyroll fold domain-containing protein [Flavobacterium sp.]|uniref:LamG-like jellyroll fold domain-containing protein n=1 Tax=Flavobacterium sp. TaxID=239 RepID=UPI00326443C9
MKKLLLITFGAFLTSVSSFAQSVNNYNFTAVQGNYIPLTGVPGVTDTSLGATADDEISTAIALPFTFTFAGTAYNSIKVSSNGWLSFATGTLNDANDNTQANAELKKPILFPLWDNLKCTVKPRYITTGIAPHRRFKVEWSQQSWNNGVAGDVISFQVWLFETTNVVEFLYSQGAVTVNNTATGGASIGIYDGTSKFLTLNNSGSTPVAQPEVFTTNILTKPATGQIYRFSPPAAASASLQVNNYCFSTSTAIYSNLLSTTDFPGLGASADDNLSGSVTLPFSFNFGGTFYSNVRLSSNGWLTFASPNTSAAQSYNNNLTNANLIKPALLALWDDIECTVVPKYTVSGTAPNRIFKIEMSKQKWNYLSAADVISFQIWLYEKSNIIEYIYKQGDTAVNNTTLGASIGLYDANGKYLSLNNTSANPTASSTAFTTNISQKPATGQVYRFAPPPVISYPGNAFIAIGKVGVTQTGVTGGTYSASPSGLSFVSTTTGEVDLAATAGGTYTITYTAPGCVNATTEMTIFSLLPQPTATITVASCAIGNDGAITLTNMNHVVKFIAAENDYISLANSFLSNRGAFTIAGWIKFKASDITGRASLFGQNDALEFGFSSASTLELWSSVTGAVTATFTPASFGNEAWHHVAVTGDGASIKIYIDGVSIPVTGGIVNTVNYGTSAFTAKIGGHVFSDTNAENFTGSILKTVFFSIALSASRIQSLAFGPAIYSGFETGIIAGYNYYDGAGTTLTSTPAGNNGTFFNTPDWTDPYNYYWQKASDGSFIANSKNLTGLVPGDYRVTVSLLGVSSPNAKTFTVGSATDVVATVGTGANCTTTINANWTASAGAVTYSLDVATDAAFTNFVTGYNNLNVGLVTTYAVNNVPPGPIYYRVRKNSSCGVSASSNTISYQTLQSQSPVAANFSNLVCNGFTANWNAVAGATNYFLDVATDAAFTSFVTGYNDKSVGNVTSSAVTLLTSGTTYYYRVRAANADCGSQLTPSNTITVLISVGPTVPVVGTITQATCAKPLGSIVITGLPAGEWTLQLYNGSTYSYYSGTGTGITISDLTPGFTYTASVKSDVCFSANTGSIPINPLVITTSTWNGSSWSNTPNINNYIVFSGNYSTTDDLSGCTCKVNSGVAVIVNSDHTLTIANGVTTTGGTLTFENNASLLQTNDVSNTGNIIYKRITQPMKNFDYTYWSSPTRAQGLRILSPNTLPDKYFSYNSAINNWKQELPNATMTTGKGYIIRTPKAGIWPNSEVVAFPYSQNVQFVGVPNNGNLFGENITAITANRFFLIGNPYPSALNADSFLLANTTILQGTIYLWTHNTGITQSGSQYVYLSGDYASYNTTGGTGTTSAALNPGNNNAVPLGRIAAGQSFFANAKAEGTIAFTNGMRIAGNNNQFFKPGKTGKTADLEKHRVWLDLSNNGGAFKETLVGYIEGATNGYDDNFDGLSFDANPYIDFYSINNDTKLVIQGRSLPFEDSDIVPLGYKSTIAGNFTIGINQTDGILANHAIYLEDKLTQTVHDLRLANYSFTTATGTFNERFVLKYTNKALGTHDFENKGNNILVTVVNKIITISSSNDNISKVSIYDISGKQLYKRNNIKNPKLIIENLHSPDQVLMVKIVSEDGTSVTKKIIF